ncbi:hypothetical protein TSUD_321920, partial [Trifolium subterraneum]
MNTAKENDETTTRIIQVRFITNLPEPYKLPNPTIISIPSDLTRFRLSSIVNGLLQSKVDFILVDEDYETEVFDFLIDGEFVRMSLEQFLLAKGISTERILEIEYTRVVAPRKEEDPSLHDEWVSAVDGSSSRFILTGCYDGFGRLHLPPKCYSCVETVTLATATKDLTLRLWKINTEEEATNHTLRVRAYKILRGHKSSVQSVAALTNGEMGEAFTTLVGHMHCVSFVIWPQREVIYFASWDHSIRKWDVEKGKNVSDIALNYLDIGGDGSALIAAGGSDTVVRIWDPRKP